MTTNPLGTETTYSHPLDKSLLYPIPRAENRLANKIEPQRFRGVDLWNGYEFSWLDEKGKPHVRRIRIQYSCDSPNIVESKSLKLYLGSFAMTRFSDESLVLDRIKLDLQELLGTKNLDVHLYSHWDSFKKGDIPHRALIDHQAMACTVYHVNPELLKTKPLWISKTTFQGSHLLRSLCPVTGQPDWGSVMVHYKAKKMIPPESLLAYIVSFREHQDYHESCCEKIFTDLFSVLNPQSLSVACFFTRRGGLDINPWRFYGLAPNIPTALRFWRQ